MPKFRQVPIAQQKAGKGTIPQEMVDEYKQFIEQLAKDNIGLLEFAKGENMDQARKALEEAAQQLKMYIKVRRKRGENALQFQRITQREWLEKKRRPRTGGPVRARK